MQNSLKKLSVALVVLLGLSYFVIENNLNSTTEKEQLLIPELLSYINDIDKIILKKNNQKIELIKSSDTWRVMQEAGFFADTNKVASLLLVLRSFELKERKTNIPEKYDRLGLAISGTEAAVNIILNNSETQIADVWIGKKAQKSQGTYVRKNSETQAWLSEGDLSINFNSSDWITTTILDVDVKNIKSVKFSPNNSPDFMINKLTPKDVSFLLFDNSNHNPLKTTFNLNELASGLQKLTIESVVKNRQDKANALFSIVYELFSGVQYHLIMYKVEGQYMVSIKVENLQQGFKYEEQLDQWSYVIPRYKFNALNIKLSNLINQQNTNNGE